MKNKHLMPVLDRILKKNRTVEDIFEEFLNLEVSAGKPAKETSRAYKTHLKYFLNWCKESGCTPLACKRDDIKRYRSFLIQKNYKPATIALKMSVTRRFFDACMEKYHLAFNPADRVTVPKDRQAREDKIKFVEEAKIKAILKKAKSARDKAILLLMACHGLRTCEITRLKCEDVDLEQGTVTVLGKGNKSRLVYLNHAALQILDKYLEERGKDDDGFLFVNMSRNNKLGSLSVRGVRFLVDGYLNAAGVKKTRISCHALRHSAATIALVHGASIMAIRDMLGHASVTTTEVYARLLDKRKKNPANVWDPMETDKDQSDNDK